MADEKIALGLFAHPDDAEFSCTGTLALLREKGWEIHIATLSPGDCGSATLPREEISRVRRAEAAASARLLDGRFHCLEGRDIFIFYDAETLFKAVRLVRKVRPSLVFAPSPADYMVDHEMASLIAQTACFAGGICNIATPGAAAIDFIPHLYYVDPMDGKDKFGCDVLPTTLVDISSTMGIKQNMLCCHASQRSWLFVHHGMDEYVESMKKFAASRGDLIGRRYAEGFRQHLGHSYPQNNLLKAVLMDLVHP